MSTHVIGIRPPDEKWEQMKNVYDSCKAAGIPVPAEVDKFFDYQEPDPNGVIVDIPNDDWSDDCRSGLEVHLDKLPKDVKIIRFYNSW